MQMQMKFEALEAKATGNSQKYLHLRANVADEEKLLAQTKDDSKVADDKQ